MRSFLSSAGTALAWVFVGLFGGGILFVWFFYVCVCREVVCGLYFSFSLFQGNLKP